MSTDVLKCLYVEYAFYDLIDGYGKGKRKRGRLAHARKMINNIIDTMVEANRRLKNYVRPLDKSDQNDLNIHLIYLKQLLPKVREFCHIAMPKTRTCPLLCLLSRYTTQFDMITNPDESFPYIFQIHRVVR